jgi:hypothetical protein
MVAMCWHTISACHIDMAFENHPSKETGETTLYISTLTPAAVRNGVICVKTLPFHAHVVQQWYFGFLFTDWCCYFVIVVFRLLSECEWILSIV